MDENKNYIDALEKHIEICSENKKYSIDRFDILIVSLSSGGLVLSMTLVKEFLNHLGVDLLMIKFSWILFATALISNLFSQKAAYHAHDFEIKISKNLIKEKKGKPILEDLTYLERRKRLFAKLTIGLNNCSLYTLIFSIILLLIFVFQNS